MITPEAVLEASTEQRARDQKEDEDDRKNRIMAAKPDGDRVSEAIVRLASSVDCEISDEGGRRFARMVIAAFGPYAFGDGNDGKVFEGMGSSLRTYRERPYKA